MRIENNKIYIVLGAIAVVALIANTAISVPSQDGRHILQKNRYMIIL